MQKTSESVLVCGDNSNEELWCTKDVSFSSKFIEANNFPFHPIPNISKVSSYDQSIAFALSDAEVVFRNSEGKIKKFRTGIIKQIQCTENSVLVLEFHKKIYDCASKRYFEGENYSQICKSDTFICAIDSTTGNVVLFTEEGKIKSRLDIKAKYIGCTNENIFIVTDSGVKRYDGNEIIDVLTKSTIISIFASTTEAAFIDNTGCVWIYDSDALLQIFGLPPIVYISVGVQHFAAISYDGELFTWGFNPSGQLGIGSDRPTNDPIHVLDNIRLVACCTHCTFAISGGKPEIPSNIKKESLVKRIPSLSVRKVNSSNTELYSV